MRPNIFCRSISHLKSHMCNLTLLSFKPKVVNTQPLGIMWLVRGTLLGLTAIFNIFKKWFPLKIRRVDKNLNFSFSWRIGISGNILSWFLHGNHWLDLPRCCPPYVENGSFLQFTSISCYRAYFVSMIY